MFRKSPDTEIYAELRSLNAALLRILVWGGRPDAPERLRLDPGVAAALRRLTPDQLDYVAGTPALLAEFSAVEPVSVTGLVADSGPVPDFYASGGGREIDAADGWVRVTRLFTATLLTWLWKTDRRDPLVRALCVGCASELPSLSVSMIEALAVEAAPRLRVRFADHPRFWADLVFAARSSDSHLRSLARLAVIPLVVGGKAAD